MTKSRRIDPFLLIVADRDAGTFTVEGPMIDDTPWNNAVCRAQDAKRHVNCSTAGGTNRAEEIASYGQTYGLRYVEPGSIVYPSMEDRRSL